MIHYRGKSAWTLHRQLSIVSTWRLPTTTTPGGACFDARANAVSGAVRKYHIRKTAVDSAERTTVPGVNMLQTKLFKGESYEQLEKDFNDFMQKLDGTPVQWFFTHSPLQIFLFYTDNALKPPFAQDPPSQPTECVM